MNEEERKILITEMEARALHPDTAKGYLSCLKTFFNRFPGKSAESLCVKEIKEYQAFLLKGDYSINTINRHMSAIRFFYRHLFNRDWYKGRLPSLKAPYKQPVVLSKEEIKRMIDSVHKTFYKAVLMVLYSTGMRAGEIRSLKTSDIDRDRMVITIRDGKGHKDRQALLSPMTLKYLEKYWRECRIQVKEKDARLFIPDKNNYSRKEGEKLSHTALGYIVDVARKAAGVKKKLHPILFVTLSRSTS